MEILELIMIGFSGLLLFSTLVCGLYIKHTSKEVKNSDLQFHMGIGLLSIISTAITMALMMVN